MRRIPLLFASLAIGGCASAPATSRREAIDEGYLLGAADAAKQLYWAKQALEAPREDSPAGSTEYYTWEDSGLARDGRKLAPETVAVPVFIPAPVPASPGGPMKRTPLCALALAAFIAACPLHAFLGVADTSFVTVIANPAEAADWASELESLSSQLAAARATLDTVTEMRAYAGDPRAALGAMPDLAEVSGAVNGLSSAAQTEADIAQAWQAEGSSQRTLAAAALLQKTGPGATMEVFGQSRPRDPALYLSLARETHSTDSIRSQISDEQAARTSVASELALAWAAFRAATTESSKQAALTEISQLQSQNQVMDTHRNALVDDLGLSERQEGTNGGVRAKATDEQLLAESALLNATAEGRARDAQAQRMSTVQKAAPAATQADYSGVRLWTTADSGGQAD